MQKTTLHIDGSKRCIDALLEAMDGKLVRVNLEDSQSQVIAVKAIVDFENWRFVSPRGNIEYSLTEYSVLRFF